MEHPSELLIFNKNYSDESDFGNLIPPSDYFFDLCVEHVKLFSAFFKNSSYSLNIGRTIETICIDSTLKMEGYSDWFIDGPCLDHRKRVLRIIIETLLFRNCKWLNNKKEPESSAKRSKLKGFRHNSSKTLKASDLSC